MQYCHTQRGRFHYLLYLVVAGMLVGAWLARDSHVPMALLLGVAVVMFFFAQAFHYLTVRDEGDALAIRFGPLPFLRRRIPYASITAVEPGRTSFLEGWGVHWVPGRGMTYNIWGFDCATLHLGKRVIRIGSDDVENLVSFLRGKIEKGAAEK
ncbi:MAG: hypothetical protein A2V98_01905 [Planctomycetes bacterium RBG_16_64_12]|nr:MAG: hypothetical protein A2V98_01905 [Planctomycetes bacterium RBG_16_64_12]